jgi:hypothetical protein
VHMAWKTILNGMAPPCCCATCKVGRLQKREVYLQGYDDGPVLVDM